MQLAIVRRVSPQQNDQHQSMNSLGFTVQLVTFNPFFWTAPWQQDPNNNHPEMPIKERKKKSNKLDLFYLVANEDFIVTADKIMNLYINVLIMQSKMYAMLFFQLCVGQFYFLGQFLFDLKHCQFPVKEYLMKLCL